MKSILIICSIVIIAFVTNIYAQSTIKWEEKFNELNPPENWLVIDNDGSGSGLAFVHTAVSTGGTTITPHAGQSFWVSNVQNSNLAGVIDEWIISPRISVIYEGDSLYFWAGSVGSPFPDSIKVKVSTTINSIESFKHELGYFKVDGPDGTWNKYGFDLSEFDSLDIYFAINYFILDGGPGGANSDYVWIDHPVITGDPSTINNAPSMSYLLLPLSESYVDPSLDSIKFKWTASKDLDKQNLEYKLSIVNDFPQQHFNISGDTVYNLKWSEYFNENTPYLWTVSVSDGISNVASQDTFLFIIGIPTDITLGNPEVPGNFVLSQNYPNPFNPETIIKFGIPTETNVQLSIYNALGEMIKVLLNEMKIAGNYEIPFNASSLPSGIYFYRLQAGNYIETKKMVLMK